MEFRHPVGYILRSAKYGKSASHGVLVCISHWKLKHIYGFAMVHWYRLMQITNAVFTVTSLFNVELWLCKFSLLLYHSLFLPQWSLHRSCVIALLAKGILIFCRHLVNLITLKTSRFTPCATNRVFHHNKIYLIAGKYSWGSPHKICSMKLIAAF